MEKFVIHHGDNREILKQLPDNSIDSVVTDPPYELGFMGKKWDSTGIAYDVQLWREVLRVLKPGGHLLAFSGSRTYHRMVVAIEDAGFDIRDQIMWIYGSGFPKSLDISKAIDKAAGAEREVLGEGPYSARRPRQDVKAVNAYQDGVGNYSSSLISAPATTEAKQWHGWGTALKPAHEPIVLARKPVTATVAANVLEWGVGGLNIDGTRVEGDKGTGNWKGVTTPDQSDNIYAGGWDGSVQGEEPTTDNGKIGRWPANVIHDGSDEVVELFPSNAGGGHWTKTKTTGFGEFGGGSSEYFGPGEKDGKGSAARFFYCAKASKRDRNEGLDIDEFPLKHYTTANKMGGEGDTMLTGSGNPRDSRKQNHHPTVKPTDLMAYLCRLVTPKGGTVLDPFMGSGSTGKAAMYEGFNFIGIEMTDDYIPIAKARIEFALEEMKGRLL
jgi:DNA modification methylase